LAFWQLDFANQFDRFAEPRYVKEIWQMDLPDLDWGFAFWKLDLANRSSNGFDGPRFVKAICQINLPDANFDLPSINLPHLDLDLMFWQIHLTNLGQSNQFELENVVSFTNK
jgi:hypothetical protein